MNRRTVLILLTGIAVVIMLSRLFDRPAPKQETDGVRILDGSGTYVDNGALWSVISGDWVSADTHWTLTLNGEDRMTLISDGKTVAESALTFSYICPTEPSQATELTAETPQLAGSGGEIVSLTHTAGEGSGTLTLKLLRQGGETETVTFRKLKQQEDNDGTF